jgi:hypothetical protein
LPDHIAQLAHAAEGAEDLYQLSIDDLAA